MLRNIIAGIVGLIAAVALVALIESLGHIVYPPPADLDFSDPDVMRPYILTLPIGALLFVLLAWFIATFVGTMIACMIGNAKPMIYAIVIGGLMLVATITNLIMIPHPLWFAVIAVIGIIASAWLALQLVPRKPVPTLPPTDSQT